MKRLMKRPFKAIWRLTHPVRRPIVRKLEAFLARSYALGPVAPHHVHVSCDCRVAEETSLLMDYMVRELVRLQSQVERLQQAVDDLTPATTALSVVCGAEDVA